LTYWIIFSLYYFVEYFLEIIFAWVPLYYEVSSTKFTKSHQIRPTW
jgi:hypothetical protein